MNAAFEPDPDTWYVLSFAQTGLVSSTYERLSRPKLIEFPFFDLELRPGTQTRSHNRPGQ